MNNQEIHIALSTDKNHINYLKNVINSVNANCDKTVFFHILTRNCEVPKEIKDKNNIIEYKVNYRFNVDKLPNAFPHYTISSMDRILLPELCCDISKIIYLDTDTIVLKNISELYSQETGDCGLAARQIEAPRYRSVKENLSRLKIDRFIHNETVESLINSEVRVFNAGVLLMDLKKMRKNNMTNFAIDINDKLGVDDQISLSIYSNDRFVRLPYYWNIMLHREEIDENSKIIHWIGVSKPWNSEAKYKNIWQQYSD